VKLSVKIMNKINIFRALTLLSLLLTIVILQLKIGPLTCCSCPNDSYRLGFISSTIYFNKYLAPRIDCVDCALLGCVLTTNVVPIETILSTFIFGTLWLVQSKRGSQRHSK